MSDEIKAGGPIEPCGSCRFWIEQSPDENGWGTCRRRAPLPEILDRANEEAPFARWVATHGELDGCGDWKPSRVPGKVVEPPQMTIDELFPGGSLPNTRIRNALQNGFWGGDDTPQVATVADLVKLSPRFLVGRCRNFAHVSLGVVRSRLRDLGIAWPADDGWHHQ